MGCGADDSKKERCDCDAAVEEDDAEGIGEELGRRIRRGDAKGAVPENVRAPPVPSLIMGDWRAVNTRWLGAADNDGGGAECGSTASSDDGAAGASVDAATLARAPAAASAAAAASALIVDALGASVPAAGSQAAAPRAAVWTTAAAGDARGL